MMALICSDYGDFKEYGGHYYTVTTNRITFTSAKTLAENNGGYLAIPNSAQENAFITSLVKGSQYAWIGIYDPNYTSNYCVEGGSCVYSDTRFRTVKNQTLSYKNWASSQPNNLLATYDIVNGKDQVSPLGEHWVALGSPSGQWGDFGNHADEYNNPVKYYAVFEFDTMPECYTAATNVSDTIEGKQCNTQVYDTTLDTVSTGKTYNCLSDVYGTSYCPASLATCATQWDYAESTSVLHQVCSDGSPIINEMCKSTSKPCDGVGGTYNGSGMCLNYSYATPTITPSTYTTGFWRSSSGGYKEFVWIVGGEETVDIWPSGSSSRGFYGALIMTARAAGATWWSFNTPSLVGGSYSACGTTVASSTRHANISATCLFVNDTGGRRPTEFQHNGSVQVTTRDTGGGKPWYYADAVIDKCTNLTLVPATKDYPAHYICTGSTSAVTCPLGYTLVSEDGGYSCRSGSAVAAICSNVSSDGYCLSSPNTYYEYICSGTNSYGNTYTPTTTTGSSATAPTNNCKAQSYTCQASPDRQCALVDSKWQCSPFPCISGSDVETTDTEVGLTDASNDGWSESGDCLGEIYIFNGQDNRCRSDDIFFGLFGGGCCDKDKVFLGLVACKEEEIKLAKLQKQERTHYVGQYCSKKLPLIGCIQKKKTFCAFNSKLGRIINEQGRTQLNKGWGDPKSPNCKGFTPEEFQKLDFSKLDLSEFFGDLQQNFNSAYLQNQATVIQNRMNTNLQNIAGQ